ncbi:SulP family inorganic anion transporter [Dermatobacter hominis]|uniref:SulP family inorganic anion transporter n=1 Tax=Dermatobacter hominis TaxID=2884263 RepID=UPI001D11E5C3|nr:sulfate permease [Dermatobacter hominis]UDY35157.1 sulfate permease [Dermatobacter hominis]
MLERWAPGLVTLRHYERGWLRFDLVAGVVLAAILVPQGMAYAELAGLPSVTGLYTTIACLVAYAVFGPSKVLVLGPDSSVSPLILASITPLIVVGDPGSAIALAGMLAVLVGLIEIGLGVAKLGFVADLLSSEVRVGYLNGLAITIIVGQLPKLFGFSTDADGFVDEVRAFVDGLGGRNTATLVTGLAVLVVLLVLPRLTTRIPAVLVAVVGVTIASAVLDLAADGVDTVGTLPQGFPTPSLPWTDASDVLALAVGAIGITLVSLTDTIATSSSFAARRGDEVDADAEMVGVGAANVAAGFFQGFAVSVSGSRTAVADQSGARSQVTGLVGAGLVALLLLVFNGLLADLPQAALAAVVIGAALSLMDVAAVVRFARLRRSSLVISLVASAGVVFLGVLQGIVVAIVLAILLFFRRNWWPHGEVLGEVPDVGGWHSLSVYPDARQVEGIVVFRWEAPLFFANAGQFRDQVRALVRESEPDFVVLQCEAVTDIDVTAAEVLKDLDEELNAKGVHLAFVELRDRLRDLIVRYELQTTLQAEHFFPSVEVAVRELDAERS